MCSWANLLSCCMSSVFSHVKWEYCQPLFHGLTMMTNQIVHNTSCTGITKLTIVIRTVLTLDKAIFALNSWNSEVLWKGWKKKFYPFFFYTSVHSFFCFLACLLVFSSLGYTIYTTTPHVQLCLWPPEPEQVIHKAS